MYTGLSRSAVLNIPGLLLIHSPVVEISKSRSICTQHPPIHPPRRVKRTMHCGVVPSVGHVGCSTSMTSGAHMTGLLLAELDHITIYSFTHKSVSSTLMMSLFWLHNSAAWTKRAVTSLSSKGLGGGVRGWHWCCGGRDLLRQ